LTILVGIVGKPNSGKTTFFNALTLSNAPVSERPFTTIEPNLGIAYVRVEDPGVERGLISSPRKGYILGKYRFVPVKVIDVAGLVPEAHKGRGLGNKFLDDLRKADCLIHVVDVSGRTNPEGVMDGEEHSPLEDVSWIEKEIDLWFYSILKRNFDKIEKEVKYKKESLEDALYKYLSGLNIEDWQVKDALQHVGGELCGDNLFEFSKKLREISKPILIAANKIDVPGAAENYNKMVERLKGKIIVPCSGLAEYFLKSLAKEGAIEYVPGEGSFQKLKKLNEKQEKILSFISEKILSKFGSTGVQQTIDKAVFDLLQYIYTFPVAGPDFKDKEGNIFPDCFLVRKGTTVQELAYMVHTELGGKFIRAMELRSGRVVGKSYKLKKGDIIYIIAGR